MKLSKNLNIASKILDAVKSGQFKTRERILEKRQNGYGYMLIHKSTGLLYDGVYSNSLDEIEIQLKNELSKEDFQKEINQILLEKDLAVVDVLIEYDPTKQWI